MATMATPEWSAWEKLSEEERYAATIAMQRAGIKVPEAPETLGPKDMSQAVKDYLAAGFTMPSAEVGKIIRTEHGMEEKPAAVAARTEAKKIADEVNDREKTEEQLRYERNQAGQIAGEQRRHNITLSEVDYRHDTNPNTGKGAKGSEKERRDEAKETIKGQLALRDPKVAEEMVLKGDDMPDNTLNETERNELLRIAMVEVRKGAPADQVIERLLTMYDRAIHDGLKPSQALAALR
jgi:hypothetical protein